MLPMRRSSAKSTSVQQPHSSTVLASTVGRIDQGGALESGSTDSDVSSKLHFHLKVVSIGLTYSTVGSHVNPID